MPKTKPYQIILTEKEQALKEQRDIFKEELIRGYNEALMAFIIWLKGAGHLSTDLTTCQLLQTYLYSKEFF